MMQEVCNVHLARKTFTYVIASDYSKDTFPLVGAIIPPKTPLTKNFRVLCLCPSAGARQTSEKVRLNMLNS